MSKIIYDENEQPKYKIPEVLNWEDYEYRPCLECSCNKLSVINGKTYKYIIGICYTPHGTMACYECPNCGKRLRWHMDINDFKDIADLRPEWQIRETI